MTHELLLSRVAGVVWAAVRVDGRTVELHAERAAEPPVVGRIVKARVTRVVPSIQAAFVDLGDELTGFVPADRIPDGVGSARAPGRPLQERLREGSELIVQVSRETSASKAHRATARFAIPGRRLVLRAVDPGHAVSRRIVNAAERSRLAGLLETLDAAGGSFIARTAAEASAVDELRVEAASLRAELLEIHRRAAGLAAPATIAEGPPLVDRLLLDAPPGGWARVVVDADADHDVVRRASQRFPGAVGSLHRHDGCGTLYDASGLRDEIERALRPRVWLASGGRVTIEQTEALVAIDVDSGRAVRGNDPRATVLTVNLEAATEIARQLRLRGLGGIIVIDFIDMELAEDRERVAATLAASLEHDPARTRIGPLGEFGLMQLTRRRTRADLDSTLRRPCASCAGRGRERRPDVVVADALAAWIRRDGAARGLPIRLAPGTADVARHSWPDAALRELAIDPTLAPDRWRVGDGPRDDER